MTSSRPSATNGGYKYTTCAAPRGSATALGSRDAGARTGPLARRLAPPSVTAQCSTTHHHPPNTHARRIKSVEAQKRRAASAKRRRGAADEADESRAEDEAFALGLSDECPRCGKSFLEIGDTEAQCLHLTQCTDANAINKHKEKKRKRQEKEDTKVRGSGGSGLFIQVQCCDARSLPITLFP